MEILMTPESVLAGIVVEAGTGVPVADALVRSGPTEGWGNGSSSRTDSEGRFRITRLEPGRYKPDAEIRGAYGQLAASVLLGLGETADEIRIEMHVAYIVNGQVLIEGTDTPCKNGSVNIAEKGGSNRGWGNMDKDTQQLEFGSVQPGRYSLNVHCERYVSKEEYPELVVEDTDQEGLRWYVEAGESIAGTVKSSSGQPISDADIVARRIGGGSNWMRSSARATSKDDGSFLIEGVQIGEYEVSASADDLLAATEGPQVTVAPGEIPTVDLVFVESSSIRGTLVDQNGEPVAKASIFARGLDIVGRGRTQVLDDGSFELKTMRPGRYNVRATGAMRAPGKGDDDVQGKKVDVSIGEVAEVHLIVETQSGIITGQVVDQNGAPVVDAFVESQRESERAGAAAGSAKRRVRWSWNSKPALTDMDGNFELKNLAPGTFTLRAYRNGGGEALAEHVAVGESAVLKIRSTASIVGTVVAGATVHEFTITAVDKGSGVSRSESFFRTQGIWSMTELPAGTYDLTAKASQGTASELGLVVAEGEEKSGIALMLKERAAVTGRMVDLESREPIKGLYVSVSLTSAGRGYSFSSSSPQEQTTNEMGEFTVRDAPAGRVQITAFSMDRKNSKYGFFRTVRVLKPSNNNDLGDLPLPRKRINRGEESGDLGFTSKSEEPGARPEDAKYEVALVRPDGPAAKTGLEVGDIIVSIDGHDVRGVNSYLTWSLAGVKPGVTLKLGLARGKTIKLTAGPPR